MLISVPVTIYSVKQLCLALARDDTSGEVGHNERPAHGSHLVSGCAERGTGRWVGSGKSRQVNKTFEARQSNYEHRPNPPRSAVTVQHVHADQLISQRL